MAGDAQPETELCRLEVDGAVSNGLAAFVRAMVDAYVRPLGRMLFAELVGAGDDDSDRDGASEQAVSL